MEIFTASIAIAVTIVGGAADADADRRAWLALADSSEPAAPSSEPAAPAPEAPAPTPEPPAPERPAPEPPTPAPRAPAAPSLAPEPLALASKAAPFESTLDVSASKAIAKRWGLAPSIIGTASLDGDRVGRASIDANRVVRIDRDHTRRIRLALEGHVVVKTYWGESLGVGAAALVIPPTDVGEYFDGFGIGLLLRLEDGAARSRLNVMAGVLMERSVKLGDGLKRNEVLPNGDELRYIEGMGWSVWAGISWTV